MKKYLKIIVNYGLFKNKNVKYIYKVVGIHKLLVSLLRLD